MAFLLFAPRLLRVILLLLTTLVLLSAARAQTSVTSSGYTVTKLLDTNTPVPGAPGTTFSLTDSFSSFPCVTDGTTVAFTVPAGSITGGGPGASCWAISVTGGTPVRLADTTTTTEPAGSGRVFSSVVVQGIGGGLIVIAGTFPITGSYNNGSGLYTVPVGGGAISVLADSNTPLPDGSGNFGFVTSPGRVSVRGTQVVFATSGGIYTVPVTGGTITRFADSSTLLVDPASNQYDPRGYTTSGGLSADIGGGTVAFLATSTTNNYSTGLFAAPATGLTVDPVSGFVNNAQFILGPNTPVPGQSDVKFGTEDTGVFIDDSGTPVFYGESSAGEGLYSFFNGAINALTGPTAPINEGTTTITQPHYVTQPYFGQIAVMGGQAYFAGSSTDTSYSNGIFAAPVLTGSVAKIVTTADPVPGISGVPFNSGLFFSAGGVGGSQLAFVGSYSVNSAQGGGNNDVASGLYVANLGNHATGTGGNQLILSNHTGGNAGVVTVTATRIPSAPVLANGATVKLSASGLSDITAQTVSVNADGTSLTAIIDLDGQALGTYDFVITNPDGSTDSQLAAFAISPGTGPDLYGDFIGRYSLRAGKAQPYTIYVGNQGDADAASVPVIFTFPSYMTVQVVNPLIAPPDPGFSQTFDYSQIPVTFTDGDHDVLGLIVPRVPAHQAVTMQVLITVPDLPQYAHVMGSFSVQVGDGFIDAGTGLAASEDSTSAHRAGGKTATGKAGIGVTCFDSLVSTAVDCLGVAFPEVIVLKCGQGLLAAGGLAYIGVNSDSATEANGVIAMDQAYTGIALALVNCAEQNGLKLLPGVGQLINTVQCGLDTYLLIENCLKPAKLFPVETIVSHDPNDLDGSLGDGSAAHYLTGAQPLRYLVSFENQDTATAPAQTVTITNLLDANLDLSTFSLGPIGFGSTLLTPPAGSQNYTTTVDLRPANNLLVQVTATLNAASRTLAYSFVSLDPATGQPTTDPTAGFLPPDVNAPAGDGFAIYYARPKAGLATGTLINEQASIVFDVNAAIVTPTWTNTIDNDAPASRVTALPAKEKTAAIPLALTSTDNGSGTNYFNVYVSEDGGAFAPLVKNAPGPTVIYTGVTGHTYAFFAQGVDGAGNVEPLKTTAEAKTKIRGADLVGAWAGTPVEKTTATGRVKLKLKGGLNVTNQSPNKATTAGSVVRLYLSADANLDASDVVIGQDKPFDVLAVQASVNVALGTIKLPVGAAASGMYVLAVIDPEHTLKETDYTNNVVAYGPLP